MSSVVEKLRTMLGPTAVLTGKDVHSRPAHIGVADGYGAKAILRPKNTEEVATIMRLCHETGQTIVPLGGNTGMAGGAIATENDIALSLERMQGIEQIHALGRTMIVQAGTRLQTVQERAEEFGLMFPLDLGARGSATIGGNIATNAGGNKVLRYGMMREMILGLEVVLADGTILSSMNKVIKNNAGYDLKQLFIGSEGTLGIVTRAVLRLRPLCKSESTALLATDDYNHVMTLLGYLDQELAGTLSAFEVMWNDYYRLASGGGSDGKTLPVGLDYPYYILVEALGADPETDQTRFELVLSQALEKGLIVDAAIAQSGNERNNFWAIRDNIESLLAWWPIISFDVSLPIETIEDFVQETRAKIRDMWPDMRSVVFGHLGDSNIHFIVSVGSDEPDIRRQIEQAVYSAVSQREGSISAEHGIGLEKRAYLGYSRSESEIALMRTLKRALDPKGILNPGKVIPTP